MIPPARQAVALAAALALMAAIVPSASPTPEAGAALAALAAAAQTADAAVLQKSPISLPAGSPTADLAVQAWGVVPTVVVSVDASRVERAAIATGLNADVVSPDAAVRLKLAAVPGRVKVNAFDSTTTAAQALAQHLRASTLDLTNIPLAVADVPAMLSPHAHPDAPALWLGAPFLSAFQVTLDAGARSLTLRKTGAPLPRPRPETVARLTLRDNRPYVQVSIPNAKPFYALVDTAAPGTVIPTDVAEKLKLKPLRVETISRREGKPDKVAIVVLPKLSVGKSEWKLAQVVYLTSESSKEYDRNFAVIGMDFISRFRMTIDYSRSQLTLSPPEKPGRTP
jgi:hypothetical protein